MSPGYHQARLAVVGPEYHRAFIVSDLHIGGVDGFQMFSSGSRFKSMCDSIAVETKQNNRTLLLINGDFVDFLAEPGAKYWNGATADTRLEAISKRAAFKPVFDGLRKFVSKVGANLVVVLGNHDIELAMPEVKQKFIELIAGDIETRKARIEFAFNGEGYKFQVGKASALATHGNEVDSHNFTRFDILQQITRELQTNGFSQTAEDWQPSAGTTFVIDAINTIKQRFPFVDLLKPEKVTFLSLVILAPQNLAVADEFAEMLLNTVRNEANRPDSERRFLELNPTAVGINTTSQHSIESKANEYVRNPDLNPDHLIYRGSDGTLGLTDWVESARHAVTDLASRGVQVVTRTGEWVGDQLAETAKATHSGTLRQALRPFVSDGAQQVRFPDDADNDLLAIVENKYDVVFTGHTHARRFCPIETNVGYLVNTGTWAGLMQIGEADVASGTKFRRFYDVLMSGKRKDLTASPWFFNESPVAVLQKSNSKSAELSLKHIAANGKLQDQDLSGQTFTTRIG